MCDTGVHWHQMPGKKNLEQQMEALDALRQQDEKTRIQVLRDRLSSRNNLLAARAADLVREFDLQQLTPQLLQAFDHFFQNPEKSDPQCWAKNAISRALAAFGYQEHEVFLRGMRHVQMEPVWGGRSDTAGTLRSICALALVQCRSLSECDLLALLIELIADKDKTVRVEVVRAIEQVGSPSASLLLRLRAVLQSDEPEVLGACYGGVLRIEGVKAIPWVAQFLSSTDDNAAEAALAIAGTHSPEAFQPLQGSFSKARDNWWCSILLSALALTRQNAAIEFLLDLVRTESLNAEAAIEAIVRSGPTRETMSLLEKILTANPRLARALSATRNAG